MFGNANTGGGVDGERDLGQGGQELVTRTLGIRELGRAMTLLPRCRRPLSLLIWVSRL